MRLALYALVFAPFAGVVMCVARFPISQVKTEVYKNRIRIKDFFVDYDKLRSGSITRGQFQSGLSAARMALTPTDLEATLARAPPERIVLRQPEVPAQALPVSDLGEGVVLLDGVPALHLHLVEQGREPRAAALAHLLELSLVQLWLFEDGQTELRQLCCELAGAHRRRNQRWHGKDAGQHLARLRTLGHLAEATRSPFAERPRVATRAREEETRNIGKVKW